MMRLTLLATFLVAAFWFSATPAHADEPKLDPPRSALFKSGDPSTGHKFTGAPPPTPAQLARRADPTLAALTGSYDLSQWSMKVRNQGAVNSCVAWAITYYQLGWYHKKAHTLPAGGGFAPMYTYSQVSGGSTNQYTFPTHHYDILQSQGAAPRSAYPLGDYNYWTLPGPAAHAAASPYEGVTYTGTWAPSWQDMIQNAMAAGDPPVILFRIRPDYANATAADPYVVILPDDTWGGDHSNIVLKTDALGAWVLNSWGTGWGLNGWAKLSWAYVEANVYDIQVMVP